MLSYHVGSLLVAVFASAGAIPLIRSAYLILRRKRAEEWAPEVAGFGVAIGSSVSIFYLGSITSEPWGLLLAFGAIGLIGVGRLWHRADEVSLRSASRLPGVAVVSLFSVALLILPVPLLTLEWSIAKVMLFIWILITPFALHSLHSWRGENGAGALPVSVVVCQILLLLVVGIEGESGAPGSAALSLFAAVAVPVSGALVGSLLYLYPMPWRRKAAVSAGIATPLCLGTLVSWGAVQLGFDSTQNSAAGPVALLWILSGPVFELFRRTAVGGLPVFSSGRRSSVAAGRMSRHAEHNPTSIVVSAVIFGVIGILLLRLRVPEAWALLALLPALVAYMLAPVLLDFRDGRAPPTLIEPQN